MAFEAIKFHLFLNSLDLFIFFLLFTFKNERRADGFSMWKGENKAIFYNSQVLHIVRIVLKTSD
jgi:hypothetical protein